MIESINTLTVKKYSLFDKTNKIHYFKKWWNILPANLFSKKIVKLADSIHNKLSGKNIGNTLDKEDHKISLTNRIQLLISLYQATYNLLENLGTINKWKRGIGLKETINNDIKEYTDKILKYTGYTIKKVKDLELLKNEVDRLTEKYAEFFPEDEEEPKKGATFMQIYLGVISNMNLPFSYEMTMADFFDAFDATTERVKKYDKEKKINKKL